MSQISPSTAASTAASSSAFSCPTCRSSRVHPLLEIGDVPVLCNLLLRSREEARAVPRGTVALTACSQCGHVYNSAFEPDRIEYDGTYENSLHFSDRFRQYAADLTDDLRDRFSFESGHVIDVGCGQGDFLDLLCRESGASGTGYDPSFDPERSSVRNDRVTIHRESFPPDRAPASADLVITRHVLEHVRDPAAFVGAIGELAEEWGYPGLFIEVPNGAFLFEDLAVWDFIYEHVSYFSPASLASVVERAGFYVRRVRETYEGQYLCIEATYCGQVAEEGASSKGALSDSYRAALGRFPDAFRRKTKRIESDIEAHRRADRRMVLWGAGSKAVTMSNLLDLGERVPQVVDVNPQKQGGFVAGTGQEIVEPEALRTIRPDVVMIMNPTYRNEIEASLADLGVEAKVEVAT